MIIHSATSAEALMLTRGILEQLTKKNSQYLSHRTGKCVRSGSTGLPSWAATGTTGCRSR